MGAFSTTFNRMLAVSGKSLSEVSHVAGLDRSYLTRLARGEKTGPTGEALVKLFVGLVFDGEIIRRDPTMVEGLAELCAAAISGAAAKLAEK